MRSKVQWASAIALAASVLTALFGAQGTGAAASSLIPVEATPVSAAPEADTQFVSQPVVQSLPTDSADATDPQAKAASASDDADSLADLVAANVRSGALDSQMRCLAGAVYFEARGESLEGQLAVARVVINRAESGQFPASYCGVVYQPGQFSFVRGRSMPRIREGSQDWREAAAIARIAVEQSWASPVKGALYFHAVRVAPKWRLTKLARVDNHVFYR